MEDVLSIGDVIKVEVLEVDPKTGKPTRIAIKRENGKAVRISKKSNQEIK